MIDSQHIATLERPFATERNQNRAQKPGALLTCEAVLAENAFHLQNASVVFAVVRDGLVKVAFECRSHWEQLDSLAPRFADRKPDLADLCLIRMSELNPRHPVLTVDREISGSIAATNASRS